MMLVLSLSATSKGNTASDSDWLHLRHFELLSEDAFKASLVSVRTVVMHESVPELLNLLISALIPKPFISRQYVIKGLFL